MNKRMKKKVRGYSSLTYKQRLKNQRNSIRQLYREQEEFRRTIAEKNEELLKANQILEAERQRANRMYAYKTQLEIKLEKEREKPWWKKVFAWL